MLLNLLVSTVFSLTMRSTRYYNHKLRHTVSRLAALTYSILQNFEAFRHMKKAFLEHDKMLCRKGFHTA